MNAAQLREEIIKLGPWHLFVQITPEISTRVSQEAPPGTYPAELGRVAFQNYYNTFRAQMRRIYPQGLGGRSMMDCACNCGAYCFWSKELGATRCFGFDVREHWIKQAEFLKQHRTFPNDGIEFAVCDLYDLPQRDIGEFDITLFKGIFYHLPDPVSGLKIAADRTRELIIVNTATRTGWPDGAMVAAQESKQPVMSGVHGLNWFPTGPQTIVKILNWLGFPETCCTIYRATPHRREGMGRIEVLGSRKLGLLKRLVNIIEPQESEESEDE